MLLDEKNEPWFVAKEVADFLDIKNSRRAITSLDDDEKGLSEKGSFFYAAIF
ncbi:BRO family protein [Cecembia calidifontis]|uniref:BRO family protein n=1 Tax=Cecembia calidifontis TaxID=1187080 RepID=UPI001A90E98A